jgi:flagellum-specific ATP synthase
MNLALFKSLAADLVSQRVAGVIAQVTDSGCRIGGLGRLARIGDDILIESGERLVKGAIVGLRNVDDLDCPSVEAIAMAFGTIDGAAVGDRVWLMPRQDPKPSRSWLGRVLDADGEPIIPGPIEKGLVARPLRAAPIAAMARKRMGERLETGHAVFDTILPICQGQRIGVFAGSGVGKSRLLASLAQRMRADSVVIALIGERGREVREFVEETLGPEAMARTVVIASTSDQPSATKRRAAWLAMAVAEFLRDEGDQVLLLFDSLTRFAEAHRDVAFASGEPVGHGGFPPSTSAAIASIAERAGPGSDRGGVGDITAIFTVLVAGGDMDEPVADITRGILDGHVVLSREIAERGRFPAIDVRKSVSRSLPGAANESELLILTEARRVLAAYEQAEPMIQIGLYQHGTDPAIDRAVTLWPALDQFWVEPSESIASAYTKLNEILAGND